MESKKHWWQRSPGYTRSSDEPIKDPAPRDIEAVRASLRQKNKRAFSRDRFSSPTPVKPEAPPPSPPEVEPSRRFRRDTPDWIERDRALSNLDFEAKKRRDRLSSERRNRIQRMRSRDARRGEKAEEGPSHEERVRRINILLRAGVYDRKVLATLSEVVTVTRRDRHPETGVITDTDIQVPKKEIEEWYGSLTEYEKQRLYTLGRKKIDFKMDKNDPEYRDMSDTEFDQEVKFQKEQKKLADALEIVALPMLRGVFKMLGKNVDVYLTSANDDIAGGLDVCVELKKRDGSPHKFHANGQPMRFVIDMTYARMREKLQKDLDRGRVSREAFNILKGPNRTVPPPLSNARAMKLFRSMVETLGENMSTLTFDKRGPLAQPQEHVPRLIIGLDWMSAFSEIANWVEDGESFEENFKDTPLARRITQSIENQLKGLHAIASRDPENPNTEYLAQILRTMNFSVDKGRGIAGDKSLENIDRLLTADEGLDGEDAPNEELRERLYRAALAQVEHDKARGPRRRGDMGEVRTPAREEPSPRRAATPAEQPRESEIEERVAEQPGIVETRSEPVTPSSIEMSEEERKQKLEKILQQIREIDELLRLDRKRRR